MKKIKIVIQPETKEEAEVFIEQAKEIEELLDFLVKQGIAAKEIKNIVENYLREEAVLKRAYSDLEQEGLVEIGDFGGIVVDEEKAKTHKCKCYEIPGHKKLCWVKGIIGALSQEQIEKYCKGKAIIERSEKLYQHLLGFREWVKKCRKMAKSKPKGKRLEYFLSCMSEYL